MGLVMSSTVTVWAMGCTGECDHQTRCHAMGTGIAAAESSAHCHDTAAPAHEQVRPATLRPASCCAQPVEARCGSAAYFERGESIEAPNHAPDNTLIPPPVLVVTLVAPPPAPVSPQPLPPVARALPTRTVVLLL